MEISIQKGEAFLSSTTQEAAKTSLAAAKPITVVAGGTQVHLTRQEASDLADVMSAWKDVSWR